MYKSQSNITITRIVIGKGPCNTVKVTCEGLIGDNGPFEIDSQLRATYNDAEELARCLAVTYDLSAIWQEAA